jgi:hypothetical protein
MGMLPPRQDVASIDLKVHDSILRIEHRGSKGKQADQQEGKWPLARGWQ